MASCESLYKVQRDKTPVQKRGTGHKSPVLARKLITNTARGRGKISFLRWSETEYINHTSREALRSERVTQHNSDSMCLQWLFSFVFLVVFKREKEHEVGGYRISEELENEKIYGKIHCMKISKNT